MTISQREIQALIAEIDDVLTTTEATSTGAGAVAVTQRDLLEKIRWVLGDWGRTVDVTPLANPSLPPEDQTTADAIAQSVIAQMNVQRSQWLQPLQLELETLRQQRESLVQEIRHMETHQRQLTTNFLNALLNRCSDGLRQELAQAVDRLQGQFVQALPGEAALPMQQLEWLEQLRSLQGQSDQLFRSLDSTFQQVFSSLEQDLKGYQKSLLQGIENIHALGQYNEALFHQQHTQDLSYSLPQPLQLDPAPAPGQPPLQLTDGDPRQPFPGVDIPRNQPDAIALLFDDFADPSPPSPTPQVQAIPLPDDPAPARSPQDPTPPDTDWEDWDEHLFNSDQFTTPPAAPADPPLVLTVSEQELITPPEPNPEVLPSPVADAELFGGLHDPATETPPSSIWLPVDPDAIAATVETILFEDYAPVAGDSRLDLDDIPEETAAIPTLEDTIASLNDLLAQVSDQIAHTAIEEDDTEPGYHIAPGETLLETAEISTQNRKDIEEALSPETLQQLSDDLMRFETGKQSEATPSAADVTATPEQPPAPTPEAPTEAIAPENPETIDVSEATPETATPPASTSQLDQVPVEVDPEPGTPADDPSGEPEPDIRTLDDLGIDAIASLTDLMIDDTPDIDPFVVRETPAPEPAPAEPSSDPESVGSELEPVAEPSPAPSVAESVGSGPEPEADPSPPAVSAEPRSVPVPDQPTSEPAIASPEAEPGASPVVRLQTVARAAIATEETTQDAPEPIPAINHIDDPDADLANIPEQDVLKSLEDIIWAEDLDLDSGDDFVDPWKSANNGQSASNFNTSSG